MLDVSRYILIIACWGLTSHAVARTGEYFVNNTIEPDSVIQQELEVQQERSGLQEWWQQLINGNVDRTFEKTVDLSWIAIPTYSDDGGFGVGATASGLFRVNRTDSLLPPSNVSLSANATLSAFYSLYLKSTIYLNRKNRFDIYTDLQSRNPYFWGTNYHQCDSNYNKEQRYRYNGSTIHVKYLHTLVKNFEMGGIVQCDIRNVVEWENLHGESTLDYLNGEDDHYGYASLGGIVQYNSRNSETNPTRGMYAKLQETLYRRLNGTGTDYAWNTIFNFNYYQPLWKGATLAYDFYANCFDRSVPWTIRQEIASDYARMRGYYVGRFFDNNQMNTTLEFRQNIYKRFGMTAWYGMGNFFSDWDDYEWKRWVKLPSYGIGFRLEFKKNLNIRLDLGFSKDGPTYSSAFVFDMGEAF